MSKRNELLEKYGQALAGIVTAKDARAARSRELGHELRTARQAVGISLQQVAEKTNLSQVLISSLETGARCYTADTAERITQALIVLGCKDLA
jgi:ribosome-binding protein aMBF1 (putative translation factor)